MLVSPAYVVMRPRKNIDPHYIIIVLRHPFYKMYLQILATGTIRDAVNFGTISKIEIPAPGNNKNLLETLNKKVKRIFELREKLLEEEKSIKQTISNSLNIGEVKD